MPFTPFISPSGVTSIPRVLWEGDVSVVSENNQKLVVTRRARLVETPDRVAFELCHAMDGMGNPVWSQAIFYDWFEKPMLEKAIKFMLTQAEPASPGGTTLPVATRYVPASERIHKDLR
jgi:hypothetical protein